MSLDITVKVKQINSITPTGEGWNKAFEIEVDSMEIAEAVTASEIIAEYDEGDLLDEIGEKAIIDWIERQGYTVTEAE